MVDTKAEIVFYKEYRDPDAVRGLEGFSHVWLIWGFSGFESEKSTPTVRPPRLGGNKRMGVFATRSPNRPNPLGLSSVRLLKIEYTAEKGPVLTVSGADILDGTKIYDIKPYLPFCDSHADALSGFTDKYRDYRLTVKNTELLDRLDKEKATMISLLECDPRPSYQNDPERIYGMTALGYSVKFTVSGSDLIIREVTKI